MTELNEQTWAMHDLRRMVEDARKALTKARAQAEARPNDFLDSFNLGHRAAVEADYMALRWVIESLDADPAADLEALVREQVRQNLVEMACMVRGAADSGQMNSTSAASRYLATERLAALGRMTQEAERRLAAVERARAKADG